MRGKQQNETRVSVVGRRAIGIMPQHVAKTRRRRTDICVRVMAVDAPRLQQAVHDEIVTGTPNVIHDFFAAFFLNRLANAAAEGFEHFVPGGARPLPRTARTAALHGIENAIGIVNLIDGCWAFGAQTAATGGMHGIAFEFGNLPVRFIDVGEEAAGGFAVEADGWDELVVLLHAARPGLGIEFDPIVPALDRRTGGEMAAVAFEIGHETLLLKEASARCARNSRRVAGAT